MNTETDHPPQLEWTGERYVPQLRGIIALEHLHRYAFASRFVTGRSVLDIASGEGYGSNLLSKVATSVCGVDVDEESVKHANQKYGSSVVRFICGDACSIPLESQSVDAVVSFETIEHVEDQETMLKEFKRVLRSGGLVIISSPEKHAYNRENAHENPYHKKELDLLEFESLLNSHFRNVCLFGQHHLSGSAIIAEHFSPSKTMVCQFSDLPENLQYETGLPRPLYLLALCSDNDLPISQGSFCEQSLEHTDFALEQKNTLVVDQLKRRLEDMKGSLSWKLTAPLRFLRDFIFRYLK